MAEIRRVRIDRLVLSGVAPERRVAVLSALETALKARLADPAAATTAGGSPLAPTVHPGGGPAALGAAAGHAIARRVLDRAGKGRP